MFRINIKTVRGDKGWVEAFRGEGFFFFFSGKRGILQEAQTRALVNIYISGFVVLLVFVFFS